ncbi:MAG: nucleoside kinase [Oscillospiraceae bacterium]|nr:nucleoside kinase [Oscillospiraceae bacterium]
MAYYLTEINERCRADAAGYIAECDAIYADRLRMAADRIQENRKRSPIVLLSGPSGSGKTTTAMKICEVLEERGIRTHSVSLDDYFKTVSPETTPRTASGAYDLESPLCLDMDLLNRHFTALSEGKRVYLPKYDFVHQTRLMRIGRTLQLRDNEVAVFEGIHALNDAITGVHPEAFKLYISARSNILDDSGRVVFKGTWMRLMRRTVRDYLFRGTDAQSTLANWANVRRGEKLYISPFKDKADLQFDSSFAYEVPVLNNTATELFSAMPESTPRYQELRSILPAFELFEDVSPDLLADDSLLREFIGGGKYSY